MGKRKKLAQEQLAQNKKKQKIHILIGAAVAVCALILVLLAFNASRPAPVSTIHIAPDASGDLRIPLASLPDDFHYVDFGGREEIILWKDGTGAVRTAFDTCEECFSLGDVHFTRSNANLTCNLCRTTQALSSLGIESWGGCQPVSIIPAVREDTDTEIVIPAGIISYATEMFSHWDASDFSVSLFSYGRNDGQAEN